MWNKLNAPCDIEGENGSGILDVKENAKPTLKPGIRMLLPGAGRVQVTGDAQLTIEGGHLRDSTGTTFPDGPGTDICGWAD